MFIAFAILHTCKGIHFSVKLFACIFGWDLHQIVVQFTQFLEKFTSSAKLPQFLNQLCKFVVNGVDSSFSQQNYTNKFILEIDVIQQEAHFIFISPPPHSCEKFDR